eukprot:8110544-Pyramimonas_sp.AAC.1
MGVRMRRHMRLCRYGAPYRVRGDECHGAGGCFGLSVFCEFVWSQSAFVNCASAHLSCTAHSAVGALELHYGVPSILAHRS